MDKQILCTCFLCGNQYMIMQHEKQECPHCIHLEKPNKNIDLSLVVKPKRSGILYDMTITNISVDASDQIKELIAIFFQCEYCHYASLDKEGICKNPSCDHYMRIGI